MHAGPYFISPRKKTWRADYPKKGQLNFQILPNPQHGSTVSQKIKILPQK